MYPFCVFFIVKVKVLAGSLVLRAVSKGLNAPDLTFDPIICSLVPRPHLQRGKGSGELGPNPWACAEEFPRANQIAALALSCD